VSQFAYFSLLEPFIGVPPLLGKTYFSNKSSKTKKIKIEASKFSKSEGLASVGSFVGSFDGCELVFGSPGVGAPTRVGSRVVGSLVGPAMPVGSFVGC
jgi:hypothetical protein